MSRLFKIKTALEKMVEREQIPKILLFAGPYGSGKMEMAKFFISKLVGRWDNHPDIRVYEPESKNACYTVSQIDDFIQEIALLPFEAHCRFFVFKEAHKLQPVHSNRLLKSFEEMPEHAFAILITTSPSLLLETIVSRAITLSFPPPSPRLLLPEDKAIEKGVLGALLSMYAGQIDQASLFLERMEPLFEEQKEGVFEVALDKLLFFVRDLHYLKETKGDKKIYYPEHKEVMQKILTRKIPSLETAKKIVFDAIDGSMRNIKLKAILQEAIAQVVYGSLI